MSSRPCSAVPLAPIPTLWRQGTAPATRANDFRGKDRTVPNGPRPPESPQPSSVLRANRSRPCHYTGPHVVRSVDLKSRYHQSPVGSHHSSIVRHSKKQPADATGSSESSQSAAVPCLATPGGVKDGSTVPASRDNKPADYSPHTVGDNAQVLHSNVPAPDLHSRAAATLLNVTSVSTYPL